MKSIVLIAALSVLVGCSAYEAAAPIKLAQPGDAYGTLQLADGSLYTGEIQGDRAEGYGTLKSAEATYTGAVKNGKAHGFGETHTKDGAKYKGEHVNGLFHGKGMLMLSDGSYFIGWMKHDKVDRGTMHFTDGRSIQLR